MKVVISDADREAVDRAVEGMTRPLATRVDASLRQRAAERRRSRILNIVLPIIGFILTALLGSWFVG